MNHVGGLDPPWMDRMAQVALAAARLPSREAAQAVLGACARDCVEQGPPFLQTVERNLAATLGLAGAELERLTERAVHRFLEGVQELFRWNLCGESSSVQADPSQMERLRRGGLVIVHHYGPFLQLARTFAELELEGELLMCPLPSEEVERAFWACGGDRCLAPIPIDVGVVPMVRQMRRVLEAGRVLVATMDQSPWEQLSWMLVPFLGLRLRVATGVFELARQAGAPVYALFLEREGPRLSVRVVPPHPPDEETLADLVGRHLRLLELEIEREPADWTWWIRRLYDGLSET